MNGKDGIYQALHDIDDFMGMLELVEFETEEDDFNILEILGYMVFSAIEFMKYIPEDSDFWAEQSVYHKDKSIGSYYEENPEEPWWQEFLASIRALITALRLYYQDSPSITGKEVTKRIKIILAILSNNFGVNVTILLEE